MIDDDGVADLERELCGEQRDRGPPDLVPGVRRARKVQREPRRRSRRRRPPPAPGRATRRAGAAPSAVAQPRLIAFPTHDEPGARRVRGHPYPTAAARVNIPVSSNGSCARGAVRRPLRRKITVNLPTTMPEIYTPQRRFVWSSSARRRSTSPWAGGPRPLRRSAPGCCSTPWSSAAGTTRSRCVSRRAGRWPST